MPFNVSPAATVDLSSVRGDEMTSPPPDVIVQVKEVAADTLPAWSVAVTEKVWLPAARPE